MHQTTVTVICDTEKVKRVTFHTAWICTTLVQVLFILVLCPFSASRVFGDKDEMRNEDALCLFIRFSVSRWRWRGGAADWGDPAYTKTVYQ